MLRDYELSDKDTFILNKISYVRLSYRLEKLLKKKLPAELKALLKEMLDFLYGDIEAEDDYEIDPTHSRFHIEYTPLGYNPYITKDWDNAVVTTLQKLFGAILPGLLDDHFSNGEKRNPHEVIATAMYETLRFKESKYDIGTVIKEGHDDYYVNGSIATFSEFAKSYVENYLRVDKELKERNEAIRRSDAYEEVSDAEIQEIFGDPANRDLLSNVFRTFDLHCRF